MPIKNSSKNNNRTVTLATKITVRTMIKKKRENDANGHISKGSHTSHHKQSDSGLMMGKNNTSNVITMIIYL